MHGCALGGLEIGDRVDEPGDELGRGATAPADHLHAEFGHEAGVVGDEFLGGQVVVHRAVDHARQPGVGQTRDRHAAVLGEVAEVFGHLHRAGRAVDADDVDAQRVDRGERRSDLGAGEHAAGQLDGDLGLDRHRAASGGHRLAGADDRGLQAEQIELGLDDERIDAALDQRAGLHLVRVTQRRERDLPERGELGARTHRTGDEPLAVRGREVIRDLAGQSGVRQGDLVCAVGQVVFAERDRERPERVGLDDVGAHLEVRGVQGADDVGPGDAQVLVAPLERVAAEVVRGEVLALQPGTGGAVVDDDALVDEIKEGRHGSRI